MSKQSVIYLISWTNNPYFYIGQTQSLKKRWNRHINLLKKKTHPNPKLQNVYNKWGEPQFHIIEECSIEELNEREQFYLNLLFDDPNCVNLAKYAEAPNRGRKFSEETLEKLRGRKPWNKGKVLTEEEKQQIHNCNPQKIAILQYSKDGTFIKEWSAILLAARELGISATSICRVCKGQKRYKSAGGFIWKYKDH